MKQDPAIGSYRKTPRCLYGDGELQRENASRRGIAVAAITGALLTGVIQGPLRAQPLPPLFELPTQGPQTNTSPPDVSSPEPPSSGRVEGGFDDPEHPAADRVVGGRPASRNEWPSIVFVRMVLPDGRGFTCGGSVIAPEWVLTAGHCMSGMRPEFVTVIEGADNPRTGGRQIGASQIIMHESYRSSPVPHNDVALIRLRSRAQSPAQVLVGRTNSNALATAGRMAMVAGWGLVRPQPITGPHAGPNADRLLQVDLPLVERAECGRITDKHYSFQPSNFIDMATICAGDVRGGRDSCNGDSGGPLVVGVQGQGPVQVGVVSWGPGCAQRDTVGIYASVANFEDWIRQRAQGVTFYAVPTQPTTAAVAQPVSAGGVSASGPVAAIESAAAAIGGQAEIRVDLAEGNRPRIGNIVHFRVASAIGGQLLVYNIDLASGKAYQVFPNRFTGGAASTGTKLQIAAGESISVPKASDRFDIRAKAPAGRNRLYAFVLPQNVRIDDIAARGMDMGDIPDLEDLVKDLENRALRGIEVIGRPSENRGAAVYEYEIVR